MCAQRGPHPTLVWTRPAAQSDGFHPVSRAVCKTLGLPPDARASCIHSSSFTACRIRQDRCTTLAGPACSMEQLHTRDCSHPNMQARLNEQQAETGHVRLDTRVSTSAVCLCEQDVERALARDPKTRDLRKLELTGHEETSCR